MTPRNCLASKRILKAMNILGWIVAAVCLGVFVWLFVPSRKKTSDRASEETASDPSFSIGVTTGLLGGDIEDAAVARYAVSRREKPTDTDIVTASAISVSSEAGDTQP